MSADDAMREEEDGDISALRKAPRLVATGSRWEEAVVEDGDDDERCGSAALTRRSRPMAATKAAVPQTNPRSEYMVGLILSLLRPLDVAVAAAAG
jgi:hypothetical protein